MANETQVILDRLEELEASIDEIKEDVRVMIAIHEQIHPLEVEHARRRVREEEREAVGDD